MTDIQNAIGHLKEHGIESFEAGGVLMIPFDKTEEDFSDEFYAMISRVKSLLKEIGYEKTWQIDPYYYDRYKPVEEVMFK